MKSPFSSFFGGPGRQSMEPLLSKEAKEPFSRSSSPILKSHARGGAYLTVRKQRLFAYILILAFLVSVYLGSRNFVRKLNDRRHVFDITLHTATEPYTKPKDPQKVYTWSQDAFLPEKQSSFAYLNGSLAQFRGYQPNAPPHKEHTISIHPKEADLSGLPDNVKPEEIVFGFTSPYLRVREMCATWKHFLSSGAQCVIALPKEQETFVKDLHYYLEKENLQHCQVKTVDLGKYQRYEQRVLNMPRLMSRNTTYIDRNGKPVEPKWYIVADDDTQVLDMRVLRREMNMRPHNEDQFGEHPSDCLFLCFCSESPHQFAH